MTHLAHKPLEQQLIRELHHGETLYRRALAQLQSNLPQNECSAEEITICLTRLEPMMLQIQTLEETLAPLRQEWTRELRAPTPELKRLLGQHEQLLKGLIDRITVLEHQLQQHRRQAIPGLDRVVKHQQMQRAYQQSGR